MEKAIRNALDKGDAQDAAFRERVYRSAFAALERSLADRRDLSPGEAGRRRDNLKATIASVETEFVPAGARPEPDEAAERAGDAVHREPAVEPEPAPSGPAPADDAPRIEPERRQADPGGAAPALGAARAREWRDEQGEGRHVERRGRRGVAFVLIMAMLAAAIATGLWWIMQSGPWTSAAERGADAPNPPLEEPDDFGAESEGEGEAAPGTGAPARETVAVDADWITVFEPSDPTRVSASGSTEAEVIEEDEQSFLRTSSSQGEAIAFDVGQGVLEELAGGRAVFAVLAREGEGEGEGEETEIAISCDFGDFADCKRTRYVVGISESEYLFEVELPGGRPGSGGRLLVVPDVAGQERALEIFSIRAAAAD